ncbi:MAG: hypothetical protein CFH01_00029 [Alphaproteobacteria bacterium MarineAlpha2_Bin1]|nr:MAG: hypothetical protein CFH01_00029 [Alphaproteobacteria bacterium MarineAlpha2_Bin1]
MNKSSEVWELGIEDALDQGILIIEWPEIIKNLFPKNRLEVDLKILSNDINGRIITFKSFGIWKNRIISYDKKK